MEQIRYMCKGAYRIQGQPIQHWTIKQNDVLGVVDFNGEFYAMRPVGKDAIVEAENLAVKLGLKEVTE